MDLRYEFDAPQFYDFETASTGSHGSAWFDAQEEGPRSVLKEVNTASAAEPPAVESQPQKRGNIVTSWGTENADKKRKGDTGGPQPAPAAKKVQKDPKQQQPPPRQSQRSAAPKAAEPSGPRPSKAAKKERNKLAVKPGRGLLTKLLASKRVLRPRSTKQLTIPEGVELNTSKRTRADCPGEQPSTASPFKPLAIKVKEFETKTPGRFKAKPLPLPPPSKPPSITQPKEPALRTSTRSRPPNCKSREQLEEEEMANMPVFRASTLNPLVLSSSGQIGVPRVDKRTVTEPQPFQFITDDRADARAQRLGQPSGRDEEQRPAQRQSRKSTLPHDGPIIPQSPVLMTKLRAREAKHDDAQQQEFHARPVPKFISAPSAELRQSTEPPLVTEPKPFTLRTEQRGQQHQATLQAKVHEEEAEARKARKRKASMLPLSTDMPMIPPKPDARPLTVPEPFALNSEARHEAYQEQHRRELRAEAEAKRAEAQFKAKPMWRGIPFKLHEPDIPLTIPEDVHMHTEDRAHERDHFNKAMEDKWRTIEEEKQREEEERQRQEERERRRLRKSMAFVARPMPDFAAAPAQPQAPPNKPPLTKPISPKLGRTKRTG